MLKKQLPSYLPFLQSWVYPKLFTVTGELTIPVPSSKIFVIVSILKSYTALQNTIAETMLRGGSDSQAIHEED